VNPALSGRHLLDRGGQGRFDEAWQRRFDADDYATGRFKLAHSETFLQGTAESLQRCRGTHQRGGRSDGGSEEENETRAQAGPGLRGRWQTYEVRYDPKKTGRSASAVKKAVKKVGNARMRVEKRLGR
jgi:Protein of unknown function (DUF3606)